MTYIEQEHGNILPSTKWYRDCKNRNNEICRDWEFDGIYSWMEDDVDYVEKSVKEYREMVNKFKNRMGWEEIV